LKKLGPKMGCHGAAAAVVVAVVVAVIVAVVVVVVQTCKLIYIFAHP